MHFWTCVDLFWRFLLISLVAFGGSGSALSLVERMAVRETGWIGEGEFAAAVGSSYVLPGPILMMASFIGYRVDGLAGAFAATLGVFLMPWLVATSAARLVRSCLESRWLRAFGAGAGASVVGLQVATASDLARDDLTNWGPVAVAAAALGLSLLTRIHPLAILLGGAFVGALMR